MIFNTQKAGDATQDFPGLYLPMDPKYINLSEKGSITRFSIEFSEEGKILYRLAEWLLPAVLGTGLSRTLKAAIRFSLTLLTIHPSLSF